jgi:transposase
VAEPVRVRRLTDQEGRRLQQIVRRGSTSSVRYRHAMMLLASAGGNRVPVIARLVQADEDTVRDVIHRFNAIGLTCLAPQWAGGRPRLLSPDDEDFVIQTAATRPVKLGQPFSRWSLRKLAAYLRKVHGRVIHIGREALRCLLARRGITFQRTKTWKESPDPEREAKLDRIEEVLDASRTGSSRSMSSGRSGSGPRQVRTGPGRGAPTGCPPPTTAPTACAVSTAVTRSATTVCGASTAAGRAPRTRWLR